MLFEETIEVKQSPRATFAFVSDFNNLRKWDPSIVDVVQLTPGPVRHDTRFRVIVEFAGFEVGFNYTVTEYKPWVRAVLTGSSPSVTAVDVITVRRAPTGTRLTWRALIRLRGRLAYLDPLLRVLMLPGLARASEGLHEQLGPLDTRHPRGRRSRGPGRGSVRAVGTAA